MGMQQVIYLGKVYEVKDSVLKKYYVTTYNSTNSHQKGGMCISKKLCLLLGQNNEN